MSDALTIEHNVFAVPARASASALPRARLVVVDDDVLVLNTLERSLTEADFGVQTFTSGASALAHLLARKDTDIVLLDWKMPGMAGIDVFRAMRTSGLAMPVIFLTAMADQACEEIALRDGAIDFVTKTRGMSILLHRINLILEGAKASSVAAEGPPIVQFGDLRLNRGVFDAFWKSQEIPLTLTEFKIIDLLLAQPGQHVPYRALYDLVHGKDFVAGAGPDGFRANVRTFIKRIRRKFRDIEENWDMIENYAGFGYRWRVREGAPRSEECASA